MNKKWLMLGGLALLLLAGGVGGGLYATGVIGGAETEAGKKEASASPLSATYTRGHHD